jgi:hypothetical protein
MTKKLLPGILMILVLAAAVAGEDRVLNGIWLGEGDGEFRFDNGNWEIWAEGGPMLSGTYTTEDGAIVMETTHLHGIFLDYVFSTMGIEPVWYSRSELLQIFIDGARAAAIAELDQCYSLYKEMIDAMIDTLIRGEIDPMLDEMFSAHSGTYSVYYNTLTLAWFDETWLFNDTDTITLTRSDTAVE